MTSAPDRYAGLAPPLAPHVAALRAYHDGDLEAPLHIRSSLGEDEDLPAAVFFRAGDDLFAFERYALELCRGTVLDLGAGTGVHALELQAAGVPVTAVEVCRGLSEIQRERGVRDVVTADFRFWSGSTYDTVLMLMNGFGPCGTLAGLDRFLRRAGRFLAPDGQILADGGAAIRDPVAVLHDWPPAGDYPGQAWIELSYGALVGRPFRELYVDADTLREHAGRAGWRSEIAYEEGEGQYLARLTRA